MLKYYLLTVGTCWLGATTPQAFAQCSSTTFGQSTTTSLPMGVTLPFLSQAGVLVSVPGSVDCADGQPVTLNGTTVIGGDFRVSGGAAVTVATDAALYIYGNLYVQNGTLTIAPGGHVYAYGDKLLLSAATTLTGGGTLHIISPRPAPGATADGQTRADPTDGLAGGVATAQCFDGNGVVMKLDVELRSAAQLNLEDIDTNNLGDLALSGTLTLGADAPIVLGGYNLILDRRPAGATGVIAGYSPSRYVQASMAGQVQVAGLGSGDSFTFPIGNTPSGDYTPAQIVNQAATATTYGMSVHTSGGPYGVPATPFVGRAWRVVASDGTAPFDLTLQHNLTTNQAGYDDTKAVVIHCTNFGWQPPGPATASTRPGTLTTGSSLPDASMLSRLMSTALGSPNYFTKTLGAEPLAVTLTSFTATRLSGVRIQLKWMTASEMDSEGFVVQSSSDGYQWQTLGHVNGSGNSMIAHSYSFEDNTPQLTYYRLVEQDLSGTLTYSPVQVVPALSGSLVSAFPNPSTGSVQLIGFEADHAVHVLDLLGRSVQELPAGQGQVQGLTPGQYLIRQGSKVARLIVK